MMNQRSQFGLGKEPPHCATCECSRSQIPDTIAALKDRLIVETTTAINLQQCINRRDARILELEAVLREAPEPIMIRGVKFGAGTMRPRDANYLDWHNRAQAVLEGSK